MVTLVLLIIGFKWMKGLQSHDAPSHSTPRAYMTGIGMLRLLGACGSLFRSISVHVIEEVFRIEVSGEIHIARGDAPGLQKGFRGEHVAWATFPTYTCWNNDLPLPTRKRACRSAPF